MAEASSFSEYTSMTWNIEGILRNIHNIKHFIIINRLPNFIFISEPQVFQHDLDAIMGPLQGEYNLTANTPDKLDPLQSSL